MAANPKYFKHPAGVLGTQAGLGDDPTEGQFTSLRERDGGFVADLGWRDALQYPLHFSIGDDAVRLAGAFAKPRLRIFDRFAGLSP